MHMNITMKPIRILFLILSIISLYAHYLINESSELQFILYEDMKQADYKESSTARFESANFDFPNLSLSVIPIKSLVARYYFLAGEFNKALEYLNESDRINPYLMYSESLKSEVFQYLGVKDSLIYYSEKAFTGIPNNDKHFLYLAKTYANSGRLSEVDSIFKIVENGRNVRIWRIYLTTLLTDETIITDYGRSIAKKSRDYFPVDQYPEIDIPSKYVLYGTDNINKSIDKEFEAREAFENKEYSKAAKLYTEAGKFNPSDYTHFENSGVNHYLANNLDESLYFLNFVIDSLNPRTGKAEFVAANVYVKKNNREQACKYANLARIYNYPGSYQFISSFCAGN